VFTYAVYSIAEEQLQLMLPPRTLTKLTTTEQILCHVAGLFNDKVKPYLAPSCSSAKYALSVYSKHYPHILLCFHMLYVSSVVYVPIVLQRLCMYASRIMEIQQ